MVCPILSPTQTEQAAKKRKQKHTMTPSNEIEDFRYLANSVKHHVLPEDQGSWDFYGPPISDRTINQILEHFDGNCEPMPADIADVLGMSSGSVFSEGVQEIWHCHENDRGGNSK